MEFHDATHQRPVALIILDGWGYAPKTDRSAIAIAHTPNYDDICRRYPMTTLTASGPAVGQPEGEAGNSEVGHLNLGTGRPAQTEIDRIRSAISSGEFMDNDVLNRAFTKAKTDDRDVHLVGLISDAGIHSSMDSLFASLRLAKKHGLTKVYIHCILDGMDVSPRTADVYVEALEIKLADIGVGTIATLCGRFFAMDSRERWELTARAFTMLVHAEGERTTDAVSAIRNSFLRGISDEFIAPIVVERTQDVAMAKIKSDDLVVFFNHRPDGIRQLVRSLCVPDESVTMKPIFDTVCMTEYDRAFNLPAAFRPMPEKNPLTEVLSANEIATFKITELSRFQHLTHFFDGGADSQHDFEQQVLVSGQPAGVGIDRPESQSFKIADRVLRSIESSPNGVFVANLPAADLMAADGELNKAVAAVQYVDTCLGGICEAIRRAGGVTIVTSSHGNLEALQSEEGEIHRTTANPVPFHFVDDRSTSVLLRDDGSLADVAPTILGILGLEKPIEMTGSDLRVL
jgi:2,3-bisphosphoglycerate-independent phosphoglycerate mutase